MKITFWLRDNQLTVFFNINYPTYPVVCTIWYLVVVWKHLVPFVVCLNFVADSLTTCSLLCLCCCDVSSPVVQLTPFACWRVPFFVRLPLCQYVMAQKESLMKTQTRILDNRLHYTRKIELHRKGKKSRTVRITSILIWSFVGEISSTNNGEKSPL